MPQKVNGQWKDPAIGGSYVLDKIGEQGSRTRFRIKGTTVEFEYDSELDQYYDSNGWTTTEKIRERLGVLSTGLGALAEFHAKGNTPENQEITPDGKALYRQYYQLLERGIGSRSPEVYEEMVAGEPWRLTDLGSIVGVDALEEQAMFAYSQPNKNIQYIGEGDDKRSIPYTCSPIHTGASTLGDGPRSTAH